MLLSLSKPWKWIVFKGCFPRYLLPVESSLRQTNRGATDPAQTHA